MNAISIASFVGITEPYNNTKFGNYYYFNFTCVLLHFQDLTILANLKTGLLIGYRATVVPCKVVKLQIFSNAKFSLCSQWSTAPRSGSTPPHILNLCTRWRGVISTPGLPTDWLNGLRSQSGRFWEGKDLLALPSQACSLVTAPTEYWWLNCAAMDHIGHNTRSCN